MPIEAPPDDLRLLIAARAGNEPAARALWSRHAPALTAYARSILRHEHDAEDAVQSAFARVLRTPRRSLRRVSSVRGFLAGLTRSAALNHLRAARRAVARAQAARPTDPPTGAPADRSTDPAESADRLRELLDALPRRQREVIVLRHVAGLTFDQVAAALSTHRSTVSSRYHAGLAALRRGFEHERSIRGAPPRRRSPEIRHARSI